MSELPDWPVVFDTQGGRIVNGDDFEFDLDAAAIAIMSSRAEAWEARCRLAVEALKDVTVNPDEREKYYSFRKYMRGIDGCTCPGDHFCKCGRSSIEMNIDDLIDSAEGAFKALAEIGPLPPLPKEAGR